MKKILSFIYILMAATLWGIISLFYDQLSSVGYSPLQIVWLRTTAAMFMMGLYVLLLDRTLLKIRLKDCWMFFGSGVISLAFFNFCYFCAIDEASASTAAVLLYTAPIFVMILSIVLFKERMTFAKAAALILTVAGCVCVTELLFETRVTTTGVLFGLGAGIGYALYSIFGKIALRRYSTETITFYTFVFASVAVMPFCNIGDVIGKAIDSPTVTLSYSSAIGFFVTLLPYLLYTKGLQQVPAGQASVMATWEPVVASIVGVLFLNNSFSILKLVGLVLILIAIILVSFNKHQPTQKTGLND